MSEQPPQPLPPPPGQMTVRQALEVGIAHHHAKRYREAEAVYRHVLQHQPNDPDALHLLGLLAHIHGRNESARDLVSRATQLAPTTPAFWNTLGEINRVLGRLDPAFHCYHKALRYFPNMAEAFNNLGILHAYRNELEKSETHFRKAIALRPDYAEAHDGLGLTLLMSGNLHQGWEEQEWRWRKDVLAALRRSFPQPQWRGEPLGATAGVLAKRILIHAEQGFGDMIQFCRYVPLLREAQPEAYIIFEVPPELKDLITTLGGYDELVIKDGPGDAHLPPFDTHSALMSLPYAMGTTLETIPNRVPYLHADRDKARLWEEKLGKLPPGLKVGIGWAGRPAHPRDAGRSVPLSHFAPFAKVPGVQLISLQKGDAARQIDANPGLIAYNAGNELESFADSAALVSVLDLVIGVDTSLVHLAGSLGKPFFAMLPFSADWRWLMDREDTPWYPTGRLFRQRIDTQWQMPIAQAAVALGELAKRK